MRSSGGYNLTRQGDYILAATIPETSDIALRTYQVCVSRSCNPDQIELYTISLRDNLPNIPIPLRISDPDVALQLQTLVDACYADGRYYLMKYDHQPRGKFDAADAEFIHETLGKNTTEPS